MPRRGGIKKRKQAPDPVFGELIVSRFIASIMFDGKKSVAQKTLYSALEHVAEKTKRESLEVFKKAIDNVKPMLEVKSRPSWWRNLSSAN